MALKNVVIDPLTKKFVGIKSERGQEILAMQELQTSSVITSEEEEEERVDLGREVFDDKEMLIPEGDVDVTSDETIYEENIQTQVLREQADLASKYEGITSYEDVPFIKERLISGKFVKINTERQNKNKTLSIVINMGVEQNNTLKKQESFVFYMSTGHIVRNGKTFIHRGFKDCGNLGETVTAFEKYWNRREQKYLKNLEK